MTATRRLFSQHYATRKPSVLSSVYTARCSGDASLTLLLQYLYFRAFVHDPSLHKQFVKWGYLQLETIHA